MKKTLLMLAILGLMLPPLTAQTAQEQDKGVFKEGSFSFFQKIMNELNAFYGSAPSAPPQGRPGFMGRQRRKPFQMDFSGRHYPTDMSKYSVQWHNPVESQGRTSTCWAFSTLSFLESDIYRLQHIKVKLSQAFVVYQEYLDKADRFVEMRGNSYFAEGAEGNSVTRQIGDHGIVPYEAYTGLKEGQPFHDHQALFDELDAFLKGIKAGGNWNNAFVQDSVKAILNHHLGTPPEKFSYQGKEYTPISFRDKVLKLKAHDYVEIMSYMQQPYWQQVEYEVPDNWWHDKSYYNVPLDSFMECLKNAVKAGYTVAIGGDTSEPGYNTDLKVGVVPSFDIPRDFIDENARQHRFSNRTTTDDHGIHILGCFIDGNDWWFLIKDSGSGARNTEPVGYRFIREDYIKLKWMGFTVHRSAVEDILKKFKQQ